MQNPCMKKITRAKAKGAGEILKIPAEGVEQIRCNRWKLDVSGDKCGEKYTKARRNCAAIRSVCKKTNFF